MILTKGQLEILENSIIWLQEELSQFEEPDTVEEVEDLFAEIAVPLLIAIDIHASKHSKVVEFLASRMAGALTQKQQKESNTTWN